METYTFNDKLWWLAARQGKITGSRLKDVITKRGTGKKIGYYELIAERLGVPADDENPMVRGSRLEADAIERFKEETKREVDTSLILWTVSEFESIALSPDGIIIDKKFPNTEAIEVKCLSSARHIEAFLTQKVPDEYWYQCMQYFIVNEDLQQLHFVCYDPRFSMLVDPKKRRKPLDYFVIEVRRGDFITKDEKTGKVTNEIEETLKYEIQMIEDVEKIVNELTF